MHQQILAAITAELQSNLTGGVVGRILQLTRYSVVIDFRRTQNGVLLFDVSPNEPRLHLVQRSLKELDKQSSAAAEFVQTLRAKLTGAILQSVSQHADDRIVRFNFSRSEETGEMSRHTLVAQLTGRSANLFLLGREERIISAMRSLKGDGQQPGESYLPPPLHGGGGTDAPAFTKGEFKSISAAADDYYQQLAASAEFDSKVGVARNKLRQQAARLQKLRQHLQNDLISHGDPEVHKRQGDLLLANIGSAKRHGDMVTVADLFTEGEPAIQIQVDKNISLQAAAAQFFTRYGKAKRAIGQICTRLTEIEAQLQELERQEEALQQIARTRDHERLGLLLQAVTPLKKQPRPSKSQAPAEKIPGVRRYLSSDGYEILVGRAARDNDHLTFRVGRASDLWLHAADYPGSHVIIRNTARKDIPQRTMIEAAQLAAKFSQAGADAKVNVHYTQQKYVSRIKGAAPGLVRLSSFRTMTVEPKEAVERI